MSNHGFLLFSNHHLVPKSVAEEDREEWDSIFHDKLPQLLRTRSYKNKFRAIFARVGGHNDKFCFGGHLQLQLKLRTALKIAEARSWHKNASPEKREEFKLIVRACNLLQEHYRGLVKVFRFVSDLIIFVCVFILKWGSPSRFINQPRSLRQRLWPHHEGAARSFTFPNE